MAKKKNDFSEGKNYLRNKDLYEEIVKCKIDGKLSDRAYKMFLILTDKVSMKMKYRDPEDKKDCIAYAHLDILKYWKSFNPEKSNNAFAYYTEVIKKGFAKGWNHLHPKKYEGTIRINGSLDSEGIYSL